MSDAATAKQVWAVFVQRYGQPAGELGPERFFREQLGVELDVWQVDASRAYGRGERHISIRACHGPGKEMPVDLVVPTPDGNRRWGDLQPGDRLWAVDGTPTRITARFDHQDKQIWRVHFSDGTSTLAGGEHLWEVEELYRGKVAEWQTRVLNTDEIRESGLYLRNGPNAKRKRFRLPRYEAIQFPSQSFLVDPYTFGLWLGDGDTQGRITGIDAEIHAHCEALGANWYGDERTGHAKYTCTIPGLMQHLSSLYGAIPRSYEKYIPANYKAASVRQRRALLSGLLDTDGTVGRDGSITYCTTSRRLADDVLWLVRSLGGIAREGAVKHPWYRDVDGDKVYGRDAYNISLCFADPSWLFRIARKRDRVRVPQERFTRRWITDITPEGRSDAMCVTVAHPRALYLVNDFIVTHNTAWIAWCIVHSLLFRHPLKAVATAPSRGQLEGALMKEVGKWIGKLQPGLQQLFEIKSMSVELRANPKGVSFEARTARPENPETLQGIHEDEGWVLIIVDEASGVHEKIFESAAGSMSGHNCQTILLANPTRTSGYFFRTHHQDKDLWHTIKVSYKDSKRVTQEFVDMIARQYGRESNAFRVRVEGEFPLTDADTIIPFELAIQAQERDIKMGEWLRPIWGVDVAYKGDDNNAIVKRNVVGVLPDIRVWGGTDTMQTAGKVMQLWEATPVHQKPPEILIDIIGYGAGVHDRLLELGLPVRGINVSESDSVDPRFRNMSTQLWWRCREWLEDKGHTLPICDGTCPDKQSCVHDRLLMEMTSRQYDHTSTGRLLIESKKDMKKRGYKSPDVADALMLTFASDLATLVHGSDGWGVTQPWNEPIARGRAHV